MAEAGNRCGRAEGASFGLKSPEPVWAGAWWPGKLPVARHDSSPQASSERYRVSQSLTGRHRASARPSTPLTPLGAAVTDRAAQVGRGGVIVAMTSGLVLTLAVPGHDSGVARAAAQWIGQLSRSTAAGEGDLQLQVQKPTITPRGQTT